MTDDEARNLAADMRRDQADRERAAASPPDAPAFDHDCDRCLFLGTYEGRDLYYCEEGSFETVIARHSSDPGDYTSGLILDGVDPLITEGARRARNKGYLSPE